MCIRSPSLEEIEDRLRGSRRESPSFDDDERFRYSRTRRRSNSYEELARSRKRRTPSVDRWENGMLLIDRLLHVITSCRFSKLWDTFVTLCQSFWLFMFLCALHSDYFFCHLILAKLLPIFLSLILTPLSCVIFWRLTFIQLLITTQLWVAWFREMGASLLYQ